MASLRRQTVDDETADADADTVSLHNFYQPSWRINTTFSYVQSCSTTRFSHLFYHFQETSKLTNKEKDIIAILCVYEYN